MLEVILVMFVNSLLGSYIEVIWGWRHMLPVFIKKSITKEKMSYHEQFVIGGHSLWMNLIYMVALTGFYFLTMLLFKYIGWFALIPMGVLGASITLFEAGLGLFLEKVFNVRIFPQYTKEEGGILGGYTKWYFIPIWGSVGVLYSIFSILVIGKIL